MSFDWEKFDKQVDIEALKEDVEEVEENGFGDYEEVPEGEYEVEVNKMELTQSKKGDPMLTIWFKIVSGDYEGQLIFYNGVMQPQNDRAWGFQVHRNNQMLRSLWNKGKDDVKFNGFADYASLVDEIFDDIDGNFEYVLEKKKDKKGFDQYKILEVFELE